MTRYVVTFVALLVLTSLTLALSFVPLGAGQAPAAMAIAIGKSLLIALVFMHLVEHRGSSQLAFLLSIVLAVTLIGLTWLDVVTRGRVDRQPPIARGLDDASARRPPHARPRARL
jgi:cytochrome c oxidase subunit 4